MIILPSIYEKYMKNELERILEGKLRKEKVQFALNCVKDFGNLYSSIESNKCIELMEKWLIDNNSVNINSLMLSSIGIYFLKTDSDLKNSYNNSVSSAVQSIYFSRSIARIFNMLDCIFKITAKYTHSDNLIRFYINELSMELKPHSDQLITPVFDLTNKEDFKVAIDWIIEYKHEDLIQVQEEKEYYRLAVRNNEQDASDSELYLMNNIGIWNEDGNYLSGKIEDKSQLLTIDLSKFYFKFYPHLQEFSIEKLVDSIFENKLYRNQITKILRKML